MRVNVNKTKIMIFGFGKLRQNLKFTYENVDIEISLRNIEKRKEKRFSLV
jgi:hypothetical protein